MQKPHTFKVPIQHDLAELIKIRAVKSGRTYTAEIERALRSYYKLKVKP